MLLGSGNWYDWPLESDTWCLPAITQSPHSFIHEVHIHFVFDSIEQDGI